MFTDDPVADYESHDAEQAKWLKKLPVCECHGEPIQDEYLYDIGGELYCEEGMQERFRKPTEKYIRE